MLGWISQLRRVAEMGSGSRMDLKTIQQVVSGELADANWLQKSRSIGTSA